MAVQNNPSFLVMAGCLVIIAIVQVCGELRMQKDFQNQITFAYEAGYADGYEDGESDGFQERVHAVDLRTHPTNCSCIDCVQSGLSDPFATQ